MPVAVPVAAGLWPFSVSGCMCSLRGGANGFANGFGSITRPPSLRSDSNSGSSSSRCRASPRKSSKLHLGQIVATQVGDGQFAENIVDDRGRHLDMRVTLNDAVRLEAREQERIHIFFERHAVLQTKRDGDGKAVGHAPEGGPFLVHVEEDFAQSAVLVFAGAQINRVVADARFLRVAGTAIRQPSPIGDIAVDDLFREREPARPAVRLCSSALRASRSGASAMVLSGWLSFEPSRYSALALSISCQLSWYALLTSSMVASWGILIVLEMAPETNGWAAAIIRMWRFRRQERCPILPHLLAQSKIGKCSGRRCGAPSTVIVPQT